MAPNIGVVFITHNAEGHLRRSLPPVLASSLQPRVLVVNSSSPDRTVALAQELGAETLLVPRHTFNHGATRELARKYLQTEIVVMMTPDVYADGPGFLEALVAPVLEGKAALSYQRQIPHVGAGLFEAFARDYNYPAVSHRRQQLDLAKWGVYLYFNSDACAAYRNEALEEVGGFPTVLSLEDTIVAARLLAQGHTIAYVAEQPVHHSHTYTLADELRRHFDTGYVRSQYRDLLSGDSDERRGLGYAKALLDRVFRQRPQLLPYAALHLAAKWTGYRLGTMAHRWPLPIKRWLSGQDYYWDSCHYRDEVAARNGTVQEAP